jgi:hypothetical protein
MESYLSVRGEAFARKKPTFLGVLENAWDPLLNPEGIVNLGLAENVSNGDSTDRMILINAFCRL